MQEIAILLSSIAGACTAAAAKKFPKNKTELVSMGASSHIKNQINSLTIEKDILTKTITRLYQSEVGLTKIQRDKLLLRYQHRLGIILAKIEKLEAVRKHPDLGPIGDGLITLMDKKLSQLDNRLYELSSKIALANVQVPEIKKEVEKPEEKVKIKESEKKQPEEKIQEKPIEVRPNLVELPKPQWPKLQDHKHVEITTLTEVSKKQIEFPLIEQKRPEPKNEIIQEIIKPQEKFQQKIEIVQKSEGSIVTPKPEPKVEIPKPALPEELPKSQKIEISEIRKPKTTIKLPDEDVDEDDDDDLDKIKGEIMRTLSKLEQAEVE